MPGLIKEDYVKFYTDPSEFPTSGNHVAVADGEMYIITGGETNKLKPNKFSTYSSFPAASTFGVGIAQAEDTGVVYASDGIGWLMVSNGYRTTPIKVATFGDSTANITGGNTDIQVLSASHPASGATTINHAGMSKLGVASHYHQLNVVGNGGISGETTTQMLARDNAAYSATRKAITDILNLNPEVVIMRAGINDLPAVISSNWYSTAEATVTNLKTILHRFLSGGIHVIVSGLYGYSASVTDIASVRSAILKVNANIKAYIEQNSLNATFIDWTGVTCDSTGAYLSGISTDGIHLNANGGFKAGAVEADVFIQLFGRPGSVRYPGVNLINNALMSNVSSGTAVGFSVQPASSTTVSNKAVVERFGKIWQTANATATASGSQFEFRFPFDPTAAFWNGYSIQANDKFGAEVDIFIEGVTNNYPPNINILRGRFDLYKSGAGRVVHEALSVSDQIIGQSTILAKIVWQPMTWVEAAANYTNSSLFNIMIGTNDLVTYRVGVSMPRLVKLA